MHLYSQKGNPMPLIIGETTCIYVCERCKSTTWLWGGHTLGEWKRKLTDEEIKSLIQSEPKTYAEMKQWMKEE